MQDVCTGAGMQITLELHSFSKHPLPNFKGCSVHPSLAANLGRENGTLQAPMVSRYF